MKQSIGLDPDGYDVEIPSTTHEACPECLSFDKWKLVNIESYSPTYTIFEFECTDENKDGLCNGMFKIIERDGQVTVKPC